MEKCHTDKCCPNKEGRCSNGSTIVAGVLVGFLLSSALGEIFSRMIFSGDFEGYLLLHILKLLLYGGHDTEWTSSPLSRFLSLFTSCTTSVTAWRYLDKNKDPEVKVLRYFGCTLFQKGRIPTQSIL